MRLVPLLVRPNLLAAKNRCCAGGYRSLKELVGIVISLLMVGAMYLSTRAALESGGDLIKNGLLDPFPALSLLLSSLFVMLVLSSSVASIGSLFLARDLDLLLSSPISLSRFLIGRCCEVGLSTSWMVCVFGFPSLVAFGLFFHYPLSFFLAAPAVCLVSIGVAVLLGMFGGLIFGTLVSPNRGRTFLLILFMVSLLLFFCSLNSPTVTRNLSSPLASQVALLDSASRACTPGYFWAKAILDLGGQNFSSAALILVSSLGIVAALWVGMYSVASVAYVGAYTRLRAEGDSLKLNSRASQRWARCLLPFLRVDRRALIIKEYKVFARDLTHTIQLSMLLAICFIYLYNFNSLDSLDTAPEEVQVIWKLLLLILNIGLSFLVITCICSRFVFPSLSLEGNSFWILQAAPVSMRNVLRAKIVSWFIPISVISAVVFMSGAMAIGVDEPLVLGSALTGVILSYGLVGLGIGLGAAFAHFEWDYASQISTNVGSLIFMALSILFMLINLIPISLMFGAYALVPDLIPHSQSPLLILGIGIFLLALLNYLSVAAALSLGSRTLKAR